MEDAQSFLSHEIIDLFSPVRQKMEKKDRCEIDRVSKENFLQTIVVGKLRRTYSWLT